MHNVQYTHIRWERRVSNIVLITILKRFSTYDSLSEDIFLHEIFELSDQIATINEPAHVQPDKTATVTSIDKVYTDGPCGSKTLAGVLLARFERVSHVTHH